jgi:DNA processing protein
MLLTPDIKKLVVGEETYPTNLIEVLGKRAPATLYCQGNLSLLDLPGVGFCGSRKATEKGLATAGDCSAQAAKHGVVVVSGNAGGVDICAHHEALHSGGKTIIVLPEGIEHFRVKKALSDVWDWERVLVVSQFEPKVPWRVYNAMARNKIILGLSKAMIVIEAGEKGGTLDAGRSTLDANLPLFVVQYEQVVPEAAGNQILLSLGGISLNRSRTTHRANMEKVWASFSDKEAFRRQRQLI